MVVVAAEVEEEEEGVEVDDNDRTPNNETHRL